MLFPLSYSFAQGKPGSGTKFDIVRGSQEKSNLEGQGSFKGGTNSDILLLPKMGILILWHRRFPTHK